MTALELIKQTYHGREGLMLIMRDEEAKKVLVAWTMLHPECVDFPVKAGDTPLIVMARLWESTVVELPRLAEIAGVPETRAQRIYERLKAAALIYPDGTLNKWAASLVSMEAASYVRPIIYPKGTVREAQATEPSRVGVPEPGEPRVHTGQAAASRADQGRRGASHRSGRKGK